MKIFAVLIVVVSCAIQCYFCKEGVSYKYQRTSCNKFNKAFVYNTTCRVRHLNRTTQILNFEMHLQHNVFLTKVRFQATSYFKFGTVYRPSIFNYSEYLCDTLNGTFSHYFKALTAEYAKRSNLLTPCPKSGYLYVKDMVFDSTKFPQFLPIGEYRFDLQYFTHMNGVEEFILLSQDYLEVKPLGIEQF